MSDNKENIPDLPELPECKCPKCRFHSAPKLTAQEHAQKVLRIKKMLSWSSDDASEDNLLPAGTTQKLTPDYRLNFEEKDPLLNFKTPEPRNGENVARVVKKFSLPNYRLNFDDVLDQPDGEEDDDDDRKPAAVITLNNVPDNIQSMSPIGGFDFGSTVVGTADQSSLVTQPPNVNVTTAEVKIKLEPKEEPNSPTPTAGFTLNVAVSMSETQQDRKKKRRKTLKQQTITSSWRTAVAEMQPSAEEVVLTNVVYEDERWIPRRVTSSGTFARVVPSSALGTFARVAPSSSPALQPMDDWRLAQILHQIELSELHKSNFPK